MANEITELRRLNQHEQKTIIEALEIMAEEPSYRYSGSAKIMLEDDAKFVRDLFWTK